MRAPLKRAAALALATCTFSLIPLAGCKSDVDKADEQVSTSVATARQDIEAGKPQDASATLEKNAAAVKTASPGSQIESNVLLAQANLDAADQLWRRLDQEEAQIATTLIAMERVGGQIATNNANASGFQALNPTQGLQAITQAQTAAQTGDGGAWVKGTPPIPSLDEAKKREDELKKQVDELTKQRTELAAKRALALEQAAKFDRQADSTTGTQTTAALIQASNQRKEATDNEIHMRDLDTQLLPLQQQLAVIQQQRESTEAAIASTKDQLDKLNAGWEAMQKQIEQLKDFSKNLLSGGGSIPAGATPAAGAATSQPSDQTLQALASDLDQHVKAAQELRGQIVDLLNKARTANDDAGKAAGKLVGDLKKRASSPDAAKLPEKRAWQDMITLNDQAEFKLREASVYARFARLYSQQFIELAQRNAIARLIDAAMKQGSIEEAPKDIAALGNGGAPSSAVREPVQKIEGDIVKADFTDFGSVPEELDKLTGTNATPSDLEFISSARADLYYLWANNVLNDVAGGSAQGELPQLRVNLAQLALMVNNYGWYQIAGLEGKDGKQRLANAVAARKILSDASKGLLPNPLPPELTEQPVTQPTSQPSGETTPTTEPAAPATAPAQ